MMLMVLFSILLIGISAQNPLEELLRGALGAPGGMSGMHPPKEPVLLRMKLDDPAVLESARFVASQYQKQVEADAICNLTTVLSAFATPGRAMVEQVSEIQTPIGTMEAIRPMMEEGKTYYLVLITEERGNTPITRGMNGWPKWQVV